MLRSVKRATRDDGSFALQGLYQQTLLRTYDCAEDLAVVMKWNGLLRNGTGELEPRT